MKGASPFPSEVDEKQNPPLQKKKNPNIHGVVFIALRGLGIQMHKLIFVKSEGSH